MMGGALGGAIGGGSSGGGKKKKQKLKPLEGGVQYLDVAYGTGPQPTNGKKVKVHYTGRLAATGAVFDSSKGAGRKPLNFRLGMGAVIRGWDVGLKTMRVGGTRNLVIPPSMGYGDQGMPGIPPNSTLVFDVTLLSA